MDGLRHLMEAQRVAVVGASERPDAPSGFVIRNLLACGFTGELQPIHPAAKTIYGHRAWPSLDDLPTLPDAVVVAIPAAAAVDVVARAARLGIKGAVVLASGFAETGADGAARQRAISVAAREAGMALCGPNCLGIYNLRTGLALFSSRLNPDVRRGDVAVVSHSGAGAIALANTGRFGLSHVVSAGNAAVSDVADYLRYFAATQSTRVVALMLEQIGNPNGFAAAMAQAHAAGLVVVAMRSGRSVQGAAATAAHTGALAGSNDAFAAFFRRHGVIEAHDLDEMIQTCVLASANQPSPRGKNLAAVGVSGGGLAHVADIAEQAGIAWATLSNTSKAALAEHLPSYVAPNMPLDLTGIVFGAPQIYRASLAIIAADPDVGQIVAVQDAPPGLDDGGADEYCGIADAIVASSTVSPVPIAAMSLLSQGLHPRVQARLDAGGVPVLHGATPGMAALARRLNPPLPRPATTAETVAAQPAWVQRLLQADALTERETKLFLAAHGLRVTQEQLATSATDAGRIAAKIGFPVVLKIESPDIPHKTEAGGVHLNITSAPAAKAAYTQIVAAAQAASPTAHIAGVLVQEMVTGGVEALVGLTLQPPFGLAITAGPGGVMVDLLGGHAMDVLPLDIALSERLIDATSLPRLLAGFRGASPADRAAFAATLVRLSAIALAYADHIAALDLNPIAVLPDGAGVRILDALLIRNRDLPNDQNGTL